MESEIEPIAYQRRSMKQFVVISVTIMIILSLIAGGVLGYMRWQKSKIIIPPAIKKQVTSVIFWPSKDAPVLSDKQTIKYNPNEKLLSYVAHTSNGRELIISEQPTPDSFNDIPQVFSKFTEGLHQYTSFSTPDGTVSLTRPKELKGGQTAVMSAKGTLMFIKPSKDLSDDEWRQLFNNLEIIR
jgi:hypothetical protein